MPGINLNCRLEPLPKRVSRKTRGVFSAVPASLPAIVSGIVILAQIGPVSVPGTSKALPSSVRHSPRGTRRYGRTTLDRRRTMASKAENSSAELIRLIAAPQLRPGQPVFQGRVAAIHRRHAEQDAIRRQRSAQVFGIQLSQPRGVGLIARDKRSNVALYPIGKKNDLQVGVEVEGSFNVGDRALFAHLGVGVMKCRLRGLRMTQDAEKSVPLRQMNSARLPGSPHVGGYLVARGEGGTSQEQGRNERRQGEAPRQAADWPYQGTGCQAEGGQSIRGNYEMPAVVSDERGFGEHEQGHREREDRSGGVLPLLPPLLAASGSE